MNPDQPRHSERKLFFQTWLKKPLQMGTLAPVSRRLAQALSSYIPKTGLIVELGAGTGRITDALLHHGVSPSNLALVELDSNLIKFLKERFPAIPLICEGNAQVTSHLLPPNWVGEITCIASSLPFMYFSIALRDAIIDEAFHCLSPRAPIFHATYSPFSPFRHRDDILQEKVKSIFLNAPPAFIWKFTSIKGR